MKEPSIIRFISCFIGYTFTLFSTALFPMWMMDLYAEEIYLASSCYNNDRIDYLDCFYNSWLDSEVYSNSMLVAQLTGLLISFFWSFVLTYKRPKRFYITTISMILVIPLMNVMSNGFILEFTEFSFLMWSGTVLSVLFAGYINFRKEFSKSEQIYPMENRFEQ